MKQLNDRASALPIPLKIIISFAFVILMGSLLLSLPISQVSGSEAVYFDHLFTAVSMVCVTGLYTQPVAETYNLFGQIINMVLMQLGGLGLITVVSAVALRIGKRVSLRDELTLKEAMNRDKLTDFRSFILSVVKYTFLIELIATFLLSTHFVPKFGWGKGVFTSLYLSVSGFNNAGFDNIGSVSMIPYVDVPMVTFVLSALVILGGIGFSVWFDVGSTLRNISLKKDWNNWRHHYRNLRLHTRLVLGITVFLLAAGTIFFLVFEANNMDSIGTLSLSGKLQAAFFQSMTMRTAGFASVDYTNLHTITLLLLGGLMFIGGSPGGTAGGAKTSTVALVLMLISAELKGTRQINYRHHTIPSELVRRAFVIVSVFVGVFLIGLGLLTIFETDVLLEYLLFETISALGTVGVSANLTPQLSRASQSVLMCLMFTGRLGPITIFTALSGRQTKQKDIQYASGNVLIG